VDGHVEDEVREDRSAEDRGRRGTLAEGEATRPDKGDAAEEERPHERAYQAV